MIVQQKIIQEFACELSAPLAYVINTMVVQGQFLYIWKIEAVSPNAAEYRKNKDNTF
jgi:hypothetical protein